MQFHGWPSWRNLALFSLLRVSRHFRDVLFFARSVYTFKIESTYDRLIYLWEIQSRGISKMALRRSIASIWSRFLRLFAYWNIPNIGFKEAHVRAYETQELDWNISREHLHTSTENCRQKWKYFILRIYCAFLVYIEFNWNETISFFLRAPRPYEFQTYFPVNRRNGTTNLGVWCSYAGIKVGLPI